VEADDKTEFDNNLISNLTRTTLTTEELNRGVGNLLVVAVLVVGVTFAGAITVPGSCRDLNSGSSKNLMSLYIYFDMLAMNSSLIAAIILCQISLGRIGNYVTSSMETAAYFIFYSLICMGLAFTFMLIITVQERTGFLTIITSQAILFFIQFSFSYGLMLSTANSVLSFLRANPFKFKARMKRRMYHVRTCLMGRE
jgi:hypothetical protein